MGEFDRVCTRLIVNRVDVKPDLVPSPQTESSEPIEGAVEYQSAKDGVGHRNLLLKLPPDRRKFVVAYRFNGADNDRPTVLTF